MNSRRIALPLLAAAVLVACGPKAPPSQSELKSQLSVDLPAYWRASSFTIDGEQAPTSADKRYRARFRAELELVAPVYAEEQRFGDTVIVRLTGKAGERRTVYGRVESLAESRRWRSTLRLENDPTKRIGQPRDFLQARRVIVAGSAEEQAFWAERRRLQQQEAAALQQAERDAYLNAIAGEWQGEFFKRKDARLYIIRSGEILSATLLNDGYREDLSVEMLDGNNLLLTGYSVVRQDGREARNYALDQVYLQYSPESRLLHGSVSDAAGQTGPVRLTKIGG
jgi:hypothetical protein